MIAKKTDIPTLAFGDVDVQMAFDSWGCNCGPAALAAVTGNTLDEVRPACTAAGFSIKRYMSPTMMKAAIASLGIGMAQKYCGARDKSCFPEHGLARMQFTGPWTSPGANPKWAYRQTHWTSSWRIGEGVEAFTLLFDVNVSCGLIPLAEWEQRVAPAIAANMPRADGGWFVTHSWEIE